MKIAVVILNWNGQELLAQFLPSVVAHSPQAEIYVADNASTDDSVVFVNANFPSVRIIQNEKNLGFAQGYNDALKNIDADVFALVNSDIEVTANWLDPIVKTFAAEPKTAIIQPKIRDFKNKGYFEYAGAAGGFIDAYGYPFCRGRIFDSVEKDVGQYEDHCEIFWASGACFFIRSEVYRKLNGFDTQFFAHQEEIDLCWRAFNNGFQSKYISDSLVYHVGGATLQAGNPRKTFLNFRNSLLMLTKNLPGGALAKVIFARMLLDGLAGLQFLFKGRPAHCLAIVKAHFSFYSLFPKTYKKRESSQLGHYFKVRSIVSKYYFGKIKTFSKLF